MSQIGALITALKNSFVDSSRIVASFEHVAHVGRMYLTTVATHPRLSTAVWSADEEFQDGLQDTGDTIQRWAESMLR